ncbi:aminopeptidase N-like [Cloeon dipterum]|uniref:aminopeptidase N-like n=1 Tax=Cloeon dipterum TaxID=197152 RepID=UPI0032208C17
MDEAPHPKAFTYEGDISITIKVLKATDMIRMHAHNLTIYVNTVSVTNERSGEKQNITSVEQTKPDDDRQFLDIFLENELEENTYIIKIHFEGMLNSDLAGFYRSGYMENNKQKWMLVTQFEATAARRAFPCFDEPALKATFDVSIARRKGWTVLSNMPQNDQLRKPLPRQKGYTWVHFKQSLKMSSYLVAFAVSQFKSITSPIDARFKVWARPELIHTGKYAAEVAPKVVQCMENRTQHKYDLPKSDHIAVQDFEYGAMENWGLVTYRSGNALESMLLYNEENSTTYSKQATASVIAHELAHQWFGNLVSPKWWSNLWLNEGFATFLANYIGSCVEPKMAFMEQFLTAPLARALRTDALEDSHPLVVPVASPSEIKAIFDGISYSKGGSVIRMMLSILGEENFWKGLRAYIEKMKFSNADQNDLWRGLSTAVPNGLLPNNVEFKDIMDTWALQAGYPVVTVTRDYDKNTVNFTQKRFFSSAPVKKEHNEVYWVPLTKLVQGEPKEHSNNITWLYNETITMASPSSDKWILVNNDKNVSVGYYRVNYDKENWKKLSESINGAQLVNTLSVNNRVQLLMDSFALAKAKELDYELALFMTKYLNYETELTPWNAVLDEFNYIYDRMFGDESFMTMFEASLGISDNHVKCTNI